ncbi:uncharacterized protein UV8b_04121 [Ustilaginoidea virens]|uniref:DNA-(apurinic or apyrimidinic site) endonuclease 2 n=2 Tax=Ustilaginoidea virens TaxID=1159556 RepID=A0A8E5HQM9_USTVR|nr:uncharacterized protein UV8b_04121 [Ustilaginoidea virens]QUC19880.1 hypothetical protein UV8b_04121 [Ustilaginoidea virens]
MPPFRVTTWNVNGIRNPFAYQPWVEQRSFQAMFDILEADIVVMQETKIQRKDLQDDMVLVPGWNVFFSLPKYKKGYSGVAIYTRNATCAPIRAEEGITGVLCPPKSTTSFRDLPSDQQIGGYPRPGQLSCAVEDSTLDSEGRCVILEFPAFVLFGVYSPANRDESRDEFRTSFFEALDVRVRNLVAAGKQVVLAGDLNVIRSEMDSTNVLDALRKDDMTLEDWMSLPTRRIFNQMLFEGAVYGERDEGRENAVLWDLCRVFHPRRLGMNTCWDTKRNTRPANNGSRIDYILCSDGIKDWFTYADIQEGLMGSDHCPVFATLADTVSIDGVETALLDALNPPGMFKQGKRLRQLGQKDLLPLSARLIPEFDRRQSIRDMFKKSAPAASSDAAPSSEPAFRPETVASNTPAADLQSTSASSKKNADMASTPSADSLKRSCDPIVPPPRPLKRSKSTVELNSCKPKKNPGQRTLQGFFKPVPSVAAAPATLSSSDGQSGGSSKPIANPLAPQSPGVSDGEMACKSTSPNTAPTCDQGQSATGPKPPGAAFDSQEAKESWSKLLGKRVVPRCEHDEPCISLVTKKPGMNRGRSFYICPRPLGPSGEKEKGSEWRCGTFIWSSDWNGT